MEPTELDELSSTVTALVGLMFSMSIGHDSSEEIEREMVLRIPRKHWPPTLYRQYDAIRNRR